MSFIEQFQHEIKWNNWKCFQQNTAMGTGGVMYLGGNIVSGPQDSLVDLLLPNSIEDLDKVWLLLYYFVNI